MKIIVAGTRSFTDQALMGSELKKLFEKLKEEPELVCGMAKGADLMAKEIFDREGLVVHEFPADWKDMSKPCRRKVNAYGEYNAMAGMKRNTEMAKFADMLIAFWNGRSRGTKDMIGTMHSMHKKVIVIEYE